MRSLSTVESIESLLDQIFSSNREEHKSVGIIRARLIILSYVLSAVSHQIRNDFLIELSSDLEETARSLSFAKPFGYVSPGDGSRSVYAEELLQDHSLRREFYGRIYRFVSKLLHFLEILREQEVQPKLPQRYAESIDLLIEQTTKLRRALSRSYNTPEPYSDIDVNRVSRTIRRMTKLARLIRDSLFSYEEFVA